MNENNVRLIESEMSKYLNNYQMSKLNDALYRQVYDKESDGYTNKDFYTKFISAKRLEGVSSLTIKNYRIYLNKLFKYMNKDIRTVTTDDIRYFLSYYQENTKCSNTTLDNMRRLLGGFFSWLELEDYIVKSPIKRIKKIKTEKRIKETYTEETIERLRNNATNVRNLAIIDLLFSSGMRVGELVRLNIDDMSFDTNSCIVLGKGNKQREVYFDDKAKLHLKEYVESRNDDNEALFVNTQAPHNRIGVRAVELMLQRLGKSINVDNVHPHKFRRTIATKAIDKGMPIEQVQLMLGHSKIDTTMHYAFVNQNNVKISHRKYIC